MVTFGIESPAAVSASAITCDNERATFSLRLDSREIPVISKLAGRFNVLNSLAAAALGHAIGLMDREIRDGLEAFGGVPMRFEIRRIRDVTALYDVYNANPSSMEASLRELSLRKAGTGTRAIAVLGDMLELGTFSDTAHRSLGILCAMLGIDLLIAAGSQMEGAATAFGPAAISVASAEQAGAVLADIARPGDVVLFKGSRGMRMERAYEAFVQSRNRETDPVEQGGTR
jgi:UDP-N-acetylmuramyl pentapeptide synthase